MNMMKREMCIRDRGAILRFRTAQKVYEKELSGGEANTTNNRMEMTALLEALRQLKEPCAIDLYSDSKYVIDSLQKGWARGWRARGWKKADKSPALNPVSYTHLDVYKRQVWCWPPRATPRCAT